MRKQSEKVDAQFAIHTFLWRYAQFLKVFFFGFPFFVLAWYFFGKFLAGAPEPQWWLEFEKMIGVTW